jgi:hypothetical protein
MDVEITALSIYAHDRTLCSVLCPGRGATPHLYQEESNKCAYTCTGVITFNTIISITSIQCMQCINLLCSICHLTGHIAKSNSMDKVLLEKLIENCLVKKTVAIYGTRVTVTCHILYIICPKNHGGTSKYFMY